MFPRMLRAVCSPAARPVTRMAKVVLPPGTLLQLMYLRERLRLRRPGRFIEIGPGGGEVTRLLLELGWRGTAYDLDADTIDNLATRFSTAVAAGRLQLINDDFTACPSSEPVELVISCMVMEHLDDPHLAAFMTCAQASLASTGLMLALVPASPRDWGIEDDIAGHCRRYTREAVSQLLDKHHWRLCHLAGLTYPLSNLLLPLSNFLVRRSEEQKLALTAVERTRQSGRRNVHYKTHFPALFGLLLNETTLYPLHLVQKACARLERALVLLFEARPPARMREP